MTGRGVQWMDSLRTQLWPLPSLAVALAVFLGTVLPALDAGVDGGLPDNITVLLFSGGPEAARSVLQAISGSLITVTSLTFSLTAVNQIRQYGAADSVVAGRLLHLLQELTWCDRKDRYRTEILDHLVRLRNAIGAADFSSAERSTLLYQADSIEAVHQGRPS